MVIDTGCVQAGAGGALHVEVEEGQRGGQLEAVAAWNASLTRSAPPKVETTRLPLDCHIEMRMPSPGPYCRCSSPTSASRLAFLHTTLAVLCLGSHDCIILLGAEKLGQLRRQVFATNQSLPLLGLLCESDKKPSCEQPPKQSSSLIMTVAYKQRSPLRRGTAIGNVGRK